MDLIPTPWQTVGPYLHIGMTSTRSVARIAGAGVKGERISLTLRLLDGDGAPVPDGMFEIWQADADGKYNHPEDILSVTTNPPFFGFGRMATNEDGYCMFETIKPGRVPAPTGQLQASHLNVGVFGRGLLKRLATRVYFAGSAANDEDPILALIPANRRPTLLAQPNPRIASSWQLDIRLRGEDETVFFDV